MFAFPSIELVRRREGEGEEIGGQGEQVKGQRELKVCESPTSRAQMRGGSGGGGLKAATV